MDRALAADVAVGLPHHVDQTRIHLDLFVLPPVAQDVIDLLERVRVVLTIALVGDRQVFAGVDVVQRNRARIAIGDGTPQTLTGQHQRQRGQGCPLPQTRRADAAQCFARGTYRHLLSRMQTTPNSKLRGAPLRRVWLTESYWDWL